MAAKEWASLPASKLPRAKTGIYSQSDEWKRWGYPWCLGPEGVYALGFSKKTETVVRVLVVQQWLLAGWRTRETSVLIQEVGSLRTREADDVDRFQRWRGACSVDSHYYESASGLRSWSPKSTGDSCRNRGTCPEWTEPAGAGPFLFCICSIWELSLLNGVINTKGMSLSFVFLLLSAP